MVNEPKVSIIIPVYNGEKYIKEAIESVLSQTHKNIEIIIVNDGSIDDSYEKIKPYLDQPNVKYFEQRNQGVAAARNTGIRNASGELLGLLDQDDLWVPDKLEQQVGLLSSNPDVGLVHTDAFFIDKNGMRLPIKQYISENVSGMCFARVFSGNPIVAASALFKKEIVNRVGLFDESIRFSDDYDMWLRISRYYQVGYINKELVKIRLHEKNESLDYVGIVSFTLKVLDKTLKTIPNARPMIGKRSIKQRYAYLHLNIFKYCRKNKIAFTLGVKHLIMAFCYGPLKTLHMLSIKGEI